MRFVNEIFEGNAPREWSLIEMSFPHKLSLFTPDYEMVFAFFFIFRIILHVLDQNRAEWHSLRVIAGIDDLIKSIQVNLV
jgi:hypothetical protein